MYCRKTPSYGQGAYAKPLNIPEKVGYQAPREDIARPFKAHPYADGHTHQYTKYRGPNYQGTAVAGPAVSPLKSHAQKQYERSEDPSHTARHAAFHHHPERDVRLNAHKASYGTGQWKGDTVIAPGGGTVVVPQRPRPRTTPKKVGNDGSLSHATYGGGQYIPEDRLEHPDCSGFTALSARGLHSPSKLAPKPQGSMSDINNGHHNGHKAMHAPPVDYGAGAYRSPVKGEGPQGVAGVHFGSRQGGVSDQKYLPTSGEMVLGTNAALPDYGTGAYASPKKHYVHDRYADVGQGGGMFRRQTDLVSYRHGQREDVHLTLGHAGYGAYSSPRSGVY